ncbi:hypothetical protein OG851_02065 [Streptomyces sp. NBC_00161]|uniref:hypothetical protein n=1 Tax=Streptomyces sp. NBC_00161 TaxID=2975671 RepID=UPI0032514676
MAADPPTPPTPTPASLSTSQKIALWAGVIGAPLAIIGVLWGGNLLHRGEMDPRQQKKYTENADEACAKYVPALAALGSEPSGSGPVKYFAYIHKRVPLMRAAHRDWGDISIPSGSGQKVRELYFAADAVIGGYESADAAAQRGDYETANSTITNLESRASEVFKTARGLDFKICPVGF